MVYKSKDGIKVVLKNPQNPAIYSVVYESFGKTKKLQPMTMKDAENKVKFLTGKGRNNLRIEENIPMDEIKEVL